MNKISKSAAVVFAFLTIMLASAKDVYAEPSAIGFVPVGSGLAWMYEDGSVLKNDWLRINGLTYHFDANGFMQTGLRQIGKKMYYFGTDGLMVSNTFSTIGGNVYYFGSDGAMVKNTVVNGVQIGPDGKVVAPGTVAPMAEKAAPVEQKKQEESVEIVVATPIKGKAGGKDAIISAVNQIITAVTDDSMEQDRKLRACYDYIMGSTSYARSYEVPSGEWTVPYAMQVYTTGTGNCYKYAAAFGYLAKALGYDTKVITGEVQSSKGGTTPHSWVEIYINDGWYVFDPELQDAKPNYNMYMRTYQNYPVKPLNKFLEWQICF